MTAALTGLVAGTVTITDSLTYTAAPDLRGIGKVLIRGEENERPVVRLSPNPWVFEGGGKDSVLTLEGLWMSGVDVVLKGEFAEVQLYCCTFDPGEDLDASGSVPLSVDNRPLAPTTLWIEGSIAKLTLRRSICGPIRALVKGTVTGTVVAMVLEDSIVQAVRTSTSGSFPEAITAAEAELSLTRSTILGRVATRRISASESILCGLANAAHAQSGCVRFCAYVDGSRLHQPYESVGIRERAAIFRSRRFGDPDYAQLSPLADREIISGEPGAGILAGAQDGSEIGAFAREKNPIKERGLRTKLNEFMPVGLTPVLIYVT
ncbi:MAG: hypothetical protein AABZ47_07785 [Planctomycetota bacterium]